MRDTFMKAGYSLMQRKELSNEKCLKEHMIHSVMPPKVTPIYEFVLISVVGGGPAPRRLSFIVRLLYA